jgi:plastocyanin
LKSIRCRRAALALSAVAVSVAAFPSVAAAQTAAASFTVTDNRFVGSQDGSSYVTIYAGQSVSFTYPEGSNLHNVDFLAMKPTSCTQTAGPDLGPVPPLPRIPSGPGWSGTCRFTIPNMFVFVSRGPRAMPGHVIVRPGSPPPVFPTSPMTSPFNSLR